MMRKSPRRWTTEEDSLLYSEAMKQCKPTSTYHTRIGVARASFSYHAKTSHIAPDSIWDWNRIAAKFTDRSNKDCRKRWVNHVSGGLKKGPWAEDESAKLCEAVQLYGQR
jgi:hypothetical protein